MDNKVNTLSGGVYTLLGLAFMFMGLVGVTYLLDPANIERPFIWDPSGVILTHYQAGLLMVALGVVAGTGLTAFGNHRFKMAAAAEPVASAEPC